VVSFGSIPGSASLAATSAMPRARNQDTHHLQLLSHSRLDVREGWYG
jgi:hypothetical protein